jgi:hypothetical protein
VGRGRPRLHHAARPRDTATARQAPGARSRSAVRSSTTCSPTARVC